MKRLAMMMILALVAVACSQGATSENFEEIGSGLDEAPAGTYAAAAIAVEEEGAIFRQAPADFDVAFNVIEGRKVIRNASLDLRAADTRAAFDQIVALVESAGGFVAQANVFPAEGEDDQPEVSLTVRIPADQLTTTMKAIKNLVNEVVSESQNAQDVTEAFVDLEARLTNLEALEVELRALLEEVRQQPNADPDKLLRVFNEISSVRGQIEQIQGQLNLLDDLTALATLDIRITQTPATAPIVEEPWAPAEAARQALRDLITALQGLTDGVIAFALFTLPMLLLTVGLPLAVGYALYRRFRGRRRSTEPVIAEG